MTLNSRSHCVWHVLIMFVCGMNCSGIGRRLLYHESGYRWAVPLETTLASLSSSNIALNPSKYIDLKCSGNFTDPHSGYLAYIGYYNNDLHLYWRLLLNNPNFNNHMVPRELITLESSDYTDRHCFTPFVAKLCCSSYFSLSIVYYLSNYHSVFKFQ